MWPLSWNRLGKLSLNMATQYGPARFYQRYHCGLQLWNDRMGWGRWMMPPQPRSGQEKNHRLVVSAAGSEKYFALHRRYLPCPEISCNGCSEGSSCLKCSRKNHITILYPEMLQDSSGRVSFTSLVEAFTIHGGPVSLSLLALTSLDISAKTSCEWKKTTKALRICFSFSILQVCTLHVVASKWLLSHLRKVCWPFLPSNSFCCLLFAPAVFKQIGKKRLTAAARYCISLRRAIYWEGFAVNLSATSASFRNATSFTIAGAQTPTLNSTDCIHQTCSWIHWGSSKG